MSGADARFHDFIHSLHEEPQVIWPTLSLVVPCLDEPQLLLATLSCVEALDYPSLEVLLIDASHKERSSVLVHGVHRSGARVIKVVSQNIGEMYNRGVTQASGRYIMFLQPGDFFLTPRSLRRLSQLLSEHDFPELLLFANIYHRDESAHNLLFSEQFSEENLRLGKEPCSIGGACFAKDLFLRLGKFNPRYRHRFVLEYFLRLCQCPTLRAKQVNQVLIDHVGLRQKTVKELKETFKIIEERYGTWDALKAVYTEMMC